MIPSFGAIRLHTLCPVLFFWMRLHPVFSFCRLLGRTHFVHYTAQRTIQTLRLVLNLSSVAQSFNGYQHSALRILLDTIPRDVGDPRTSSHDGPNRYGLIRMV